jgi:hypothetical protein
MTSPGPLASRLHLPQALTGRERPDRFAGRVPGFGKPQRWVSSSEECCDDRGAGGFVRPSFRTNTQPKSYVSAGTSCSRFSINAAVWLDRRLLSRLSATRSEIAGAGSRRRGWIYVIAQEPLTPVLSPATRRRCVGTGGAAAGWAALLSFVQTRGNRGTRPLLLRLRLRASRCGEPVHCCGSSLAGVSARWRASALARRDDCPGKLVIAVNAGTRGSF